MEQSTQQKQQIKKNSSLVDLVDCLIGGDGFGGTAHTLLKVSKTKKAGLSNHGIVLLVKILEGKLMTDAKINILKNGYSLKDTVTQIELHREPIDCAIIGQEVGICLKTLKFRQIRDLDD